MKRARTALLQAFAIVAVAAIIGFVFNAFSRKGVNPFKTSVRVLVAADSLAAEAEGIRVIDLEKAKQFVQAGGRIIDARRKEDYDAGHIPGALLLDYYDMGTYRDRVLQLLSNDQEIMVYCSELSCDDSELLAQELYALGFKKLFVFKGGFAEWSGAGLPVEEGVQ